MGLHVLRAQERRRNQDGHAVGLRLQQVAAEGDEARDHVLGNLIALHLFRERDRCALGQLLDAF